MNDASDRSLCSRCGASFRCGRDDRDGCWCARLPVLGPSRYRPGDGCLCPACLRHLLESPPGPEGTSLR